jgi:putative sugar O-methyltransferase
MIAGHHSQLDDTGFGAVVDAMFDEIAGDPRFLPSLFWQDLNRKNIRMLEQGGLANFKRSLAQNYYNWLVTSIRHPHFRRALKLWLMRPDLTPFRSRLDGSVQLGESSAATPIKLTGRARFIYKTYVAFVWSIMSRHDTLRLSDRVTEPGVGNPIDVRLGSKLISQDLANSVLECNTIARFAPSGSGARVAELGAGYGRLAHVYAQTQQGKYFIFDIPPALAVSQWYLGQVLGDGRLFKFRHFDRFADIEQDIERATVVFLTPNQMQKFPERYFDLIVSISTFPEMSAEHVAMYLKLFGTLSRGHIFLKQWKTWRNPSDGTFLTTDSYSFGDDWTVAEDANELVNPMFFSRIWQRAGTGLPPGSDGHAPP